MNIRSYIIDHLSHFMRIRYKLGQNLYKLIDQYEKNYNLSQDEIDALVNEMDEFEKEKDEQLSFFRPIDKTPSILAPTGEVGHYPGYNITIKAYNCDHKWKLYQGLNEVYEYCTVCDVKK